jgi:benzoyl-CoA 2,3-epoxidase subunit A
MHAIRTDKASTTTANGNEVFVKQHLIDPEACIHCNTCEDTCPSSAITHGDNYVVDAAKCTNCGECIYPCPTGAIDNFRTMPQEFLYPVETQMNWASLPDELPVNNFAADKAVRVVPTESPGPTAATSPGARYSSTLPPWSAAHAYTNLYSVTNPVTASVTGNMRVTQVGREYDTHHIILDLGKTPLPVLEGQSIGVIPPGTDASGRPHHARQYSISSARSGEREGFNNLSLTVKRVLVDREGNSVRGVTSNYLCDLNVGDKVQVTGPFGASFLMPNHPRSHIVMICTGTGSAPMRAMIRQRHVQRTKDNFTSGKLMLFFGARTKEELPFFGRLNKLPNDFLDVNLAFSRVPERPKQYVQDLMRERAPDLAPLLADPDSYFYICGLKAMEEGVVLALSDIAEGVGLCWETLADTLKRGGRIHFETY